MTTVYWDASALVTLVSRQPGAQLAEHIWQRADLIATSRFSHVQVPAALWQARSIGALSAYDYDEAVARWDRLSRQLHVLEITADQAAQAAAAITATGGRAADALHGAAAATLAAGIVVTAEPRVRDAALASGIAVVDLTAAMA